jgi:hypothetical protein
MGPYKWGDDIVTSFHGRRAGLDRNDFNVGGLGGRDPIELWTAGSTGAGAASTAILSPGGISILSASSNSTFNMPGPAEAYMGAGKTIQFNSTGGGNMEIDLISGNFQTSQSSTYTKLTFTAGGANYGGLFLQCLSTAYWALNGSTGAAGGGSTHIAFS